MSISIISDKFLWLSKNLYNCFLRYCFGSLFEFALKYYYLNCKILTLILFILLDIIMKL